MTDSLRQQTYFRLSLLSGDSPKYNEDVENLPKEKAKCLCEVLFSKENGRKIILNRKCPLYITSPFYNTTIERPKQLNTNFDRKAKHITCRRVPVKHP